ncbi:MAG: hypothetical protein ACK5XN_35820 [Bacteroidota bacterium]|jgi:hypothetical protein
MDNTEKKTCPTAVADLQGQYDEIIAFLEYEEAFTVDTRTQQRIRAKLQQLGIWPVE